MKTQTITFSKDGKIVAKAIGKFEELPGRGPVVWEGEWATNPPTRFPKGLPACGYAEHFKDAMESIAKELQVDFSLKEEGDWKVYYE